MSDAPRILAFSGSARRESLNQKLLNAVIDSAREVGGVVNPINLNDFPLPLYDGDLEDAAGFSENAQKLVQLIKDHHGLLIASPEYNSLMTPLLKNTIDWCTRAEENPFIGKVVAVISASPGPFGGVRSLTSVRQLLTNLGAHVVPLQCVLPQADKAFDADGRLTMPRAQTSSAAVAKALVEISRKLNIAQT